MQGVAELLGQVVPFPHLQGQGPLAGGGEHLAGVQELVNAVPEVQADEPRRREDDAVVLPVAQSGEPGVHVAPEVPHHEVRPQGEDLGLAAHGARPHHRPRGGP